MSPLKLMPLLLSFLINTFYPIIGTKMTIQSIIDNEIASMKSAIQSLNGTTRIKQVLQDVVNTMEQEKDRIGNATASIGKAANQTAKGLGYRFWEINQKIFNNSNLTDEEKPLVVKILHSAASNADAKLPELLSKPVNLTEVLLEEQFGTLGEQDIVI